MLKNRFFKSISLLTLTGILTLSTSNLAFAKTINTTSNTSSLAISQGNALNSLSKLTPSSKSITFTKKMLDSGLIREFYFNKNGKLALKDSLANIKIKYSLDDAYIKQLNALLAFAQKRTPVNMSSQIKGTVSPDVYASNWKVYFTNSDVNAFLFASAEIGPAALDAALDGIATMMGGPVGTVIGLVLDVIGAASMANLCYLIVQAEYNGEGVYIGIDWNGPFPNYTQGLW
jgi:hypothetical protein